jgi:preprotein translocase subunit Sec61beta
MAENVNMSGGFGGLTRFKEEYNSKFKFGPGVVIGMIIVVIVFVIGLRIFYG